MSTQPAESKQISYGIISLEQWTKAIGRAYVTVWRWRKKGRLKTINIYGRPYVTDEAIKEFNRRAEAGEFAQRPHIPKIP